MNVVMSFNPYIYESTYISRVVKEFIMNIRNPGCALRQMKWVCYVKEVIPMIPCLLEN